MSDTWERLFEDERETLDFLLQEEFMEEDMHTFKIYLEPADTDDERTYLGTVQANTMSEALDLAAQWNEIPAHDLVAVQQPDQEERT